MSWHIDDDRWEESIPLQIALYCVGGLNNGASMGLVHPVLCLELLAIILQFEDSRYGDKAPDPEQIKVMRERFAVFSKY